ncbi:MAG: glycosyltransferase family 2 protein [Lachnospiraceae bacterium]|nr:glycosyltransferase family 2 protein [Lachnospiraceae bacterium]
MITISLCMIVKNEERVLARCLDTVADLVEEIIIVDTGSTDRTKEIATRYTDKIYDFQWIDDFSAARNFAFSKATKEYIYSADADEVLSPENRELFKVLKESLLPEIEIVQMKYGNLLENGTVYNFDEEHRPKLFKRLREFVWESPIHEMVRLHTTVYDSDIVITHMPETNHAGRDLAVFRKHIAQGWQPPKRLHSVYARELFLSGSEEDFAKAIGFFTESAADINRSADEVTESCLVVARACRLAKDVVGFFKYASKVIAGEGCSEICCEMGQFYEEQQDYEEAAIWYYNAVYETEPVLVKASGDVEGLQGLIRCYQALGLEDVAKEYEEELTKVCQE